MAAVVVLLASGATVLLLVRAQNAPRAALEEWFQAASSADFDEMRALTCAQYADMFVEGTFDPSLITGLAWDIGDVERVDDTLAEATVTVRTTWDVSTERWAIVREAGDWKVCGPVEDLERP